jgi:DNA-binding NarL/FixJ family response regulator
MATRVTSAQFVGRETELTELRAALGDALTGYPTLAFVAGESGVGKTRLICELEHHAKREGIRVLTGECVDLGEDELAYAPIVAALRPLARSSDPILHDLPPAAREALDGMLPGLSTGSATREFSDETTGRRARLFEALLELFDRLSCDGGLLLTIEDLHWADSSTRQFLAYLASSLDDEKLLIVATYRPDELHRRHPLRPLLAELERSTHARRIDVAPFTQAELGQQLTDILGSAPEEALVERLFSRSEGNALYAEELLAAGLDGRGTLPPTLRDALMLRVERLPAPTQEVLRELSIAGRLEHAVIAEASDLEPQALRDALREAVAAQMVRVDAEGRYAFRHALLGEAVADDLLPGERAEIHKRLAQALESHTAPGAHTAANIAHHYAQAGDQPAALAASVRAADAAEAVYAFGEAATLYERALELWAHVPDAEALTGTDRVDLLRSAAWCHATNADNVRAETLLRAAVKAVDANVDPRRKAAVLERLSRAQWRLGKVEESKAGREEALALLEPGVPVMERATILASEASMLMLSARYREAIETARLALAEARACDAVAPEIRALDALGVSLSWTGSEEEGEARVRESIAIALDHDLPITALTSYVNLAEILYFGTRSGESQAVVTEGLNLARDLGYASRWLELLQAEIYFYRGKWAASEAAIPEGRRPTSHGTFINEAHRRTQLALGHGDHETARQLLDEAAPVAAQSREPQFIGVQAALVAELDRRAGDLEAARAAIDDGLDRIEFCSEDRARICMVSAAGLRVEVDAALRARDLGDADGERTAITASEMLFARVEATAADHRPVETAMLATAHGELARARGEDDAEAWAAAVAEWTAIDRPYEAAEAQWHQAGALLAGGDRDGATELSLAARAAAREFGATWLESEIDGFAARARLRLQPAEEEPVETDDPFGLTPRERQVLELVAGGRTNREIGQTLFMAEKTASVHVSRILSKLDVRTRTEAAAVAHRLGLT